MYYVGNIFKALGLHNLIYNFPGVDVLPCLITKFNSSYVSQIDYCHFLSRARNVGCKLSGPSEEFSKWICAWFLQIKKICLCKSVSILFEWLISARKFFYATIGFLQFTPVYQPNQNIEENQIMFTISLPASTYLFRNCCYCSFPLLWFYLIGLSTVNTQVSPILSSWHSSAIRAFAYLVSHYEAAMIQ